MTIRASMTHPIHLRRSTPRRATCGRRGDSIAMSTSQPPRRARGRHHESTSRSRAQTDNGAAIDPLELGEVMLLELPVASHSYHLRTYLNCFTGTDAVKWMISRGFARDERAAVVLGNAMMERGVFRHVMQQHTFKVSTVAPAASAEACHLLPLTSTHARTSHCSIASLSTAASEPLAWTTERRRLWLASQTAAARLNHVDQGRSTLVVAAVAMWMVAEVMLVTRWRAHRALKTSVRLW